MSKRQYQYSLSVHTWVAIFVDVASLVFGVDISGTVPGSGLGSRCTVYGVTLGPLRPHFTDGGGGYNPTNSIFIQKKLPITKLGSHGLSMEKKPIVCQFHYGGINFHFGEIVLLTQNF
jgi:hypothetical protein